MIKKEIGIGFIIGLASNVLGIILYIVVFSDSGIQASLREAYQEQVLGRLIAAGAVLNFVPFFHFLNKNHIFRARGVVLASIVAALVIGVLQLVTPELQNNDQITTAGFHTGIKFPAWAHFC